MPALGQSAPAWVEKQWDSEFDGTPKVINRFSLATTVTGAQVYATGRIFNQQSSSTEMALWRINADGTLGWQASLAPPGSTSCYGVSVATDGFGYVFATGVVDGPNGQDIVTACYYDDYDYSGSAIPMWQERYNNGLNNANGNDVPVLVYFDANESALYVGGDSQGANAYSQSLGTDLVVLKYNAYAGGHYLWEMRRDGAASGDDHLAELKPVYYTPGNANAQEVPVALYVAGTVGNGGTKDDFVVLGVDMSTGTVSQSTVFNFAGSGNDVAGGLDAYAQLDSANNVVGQVFVTGYSNGTGNGTNDYVTVAYPLDLVHATWVMAYDGPGAASDKAVKVVYLPVGDGSVFVTGESYGGSLSGYDFATLRYNAPDGSPTWNGTFGDGAVRFDNPVGHGEDRATDMSVDKFENCYVGGKSFNGTTLDSCAVSYLANGDTRWTRYSLSQNPPGCVTYPGEYYVVNNGSANGADGAAALRVTPRGGFVDHDGDVFLFGSVTAVSGQSTVLQHGLVKITQRDDEPCQ